MSRIVWTLFGITLTVLAALGASALGLIPGPTGQGQVAQIVFAKDGQSEELQEAIGKVVAERDRLANDLAAVEADRKAVMEELGVVVAERDQLRQLLEAARQRIAQQAQAAPAPAAENKAPEPAPAEEQAEPTPPAAGPKTHDEGATAGAQSGGVLVPEAAPPAADEMTGADSSWGVVRGLRAYRDGDYRLAFDTWLPLAHRGDPRAQFYVGGLYSEGRGVQPNKALAYVWLRRSQQAGYHRAQALLDRLTGSMSRDEVSAAERSIPN